MASGAVSRYTRWFTGFTAGFSAIRLNPPGRVAREIERGVVRRSVGGSPDAHARFAQSLHGLQQDQQSGRFCGVCLPAIAAFPAFGPAGQGGPFRRPFPGQGRDRPRGGTPVISAGPAGRLRNAVVLAQDVLLELLETDGAGGHVLLVVGAFLSATRRRWPWPSPRSCPVGRRSICRPRRHPCSCKKGSMMICFLPCFLSQRRHRADSFPP